MKMIVNGKVYDITIFLDKHPAGKFIFLHLFFNLKFEKYLKNKSLNFFISLYIDV